LLRPVAENIDFEKKGNLVLLKTPTFESQEVTKFVIK